MDNEKLKRKMARSTKKMLEEICSKKEDTSRIPRLNDTTSILASTVREHEFLRSILKEAPFTILPGKNSSQNYATHNIGFLESPEILRDDLERFGIYDPKKIAAGAHIVIDGTISAYKANHLTFTQFKPFYPYKIVKLSGEGPVKLKRDTKKTIMLINDAGEDQFPEYSIVYNKEDKLFHVGISFDAKNVDLYYGLAPTSEYPYLRFQKKIDGSD